MTKSQTIFDENAETTVVRMLDRLMRSIDFHETSTAMQFDLFLPIELPKLTGRDIVRVKTMKRLWSEGQTRIGFFSSESADHLTDLIFCSFGSLDRSRFERGSLHDDEWPRFTRTIERFVHSDTYFRTIPDAREALAALQELQGTESDIPVDVLVLDIKKAFDRIDRAAHCELKTVASGLEKEAGISCVFVQ